MTDVRGSGPGRVSDPRVEPEAAQYGTAGCPGPGSSEYPVELGPRQHSIALQAARAQGEAREAGLQLRSSGPGRQEVLRQLLVARVGLTRRCLAPVPCIAGQPQLMVCIVAPICCSEPT